MAGLRDYYQKAPNLHDVQAASPTPPPVPQGSEFGKGFRRGTAGIQSGMQNLWGRVQEGIGDTEDANAAYQAAQERTQRVGAENVARVGHLKDVNSLSDAGDYIAGAAGEGVPSMAAIVAGGAATKSLMKNTAAFKYLGPKAASRLGGEVAAPAAKPSYLRSSFDNAKYAYPTGVALAAGEQVGGQDNTEEGMQRRAQEGLLNKDNLAVGGVGLVSGAMDSLVPGGMIGKYGARGVGSGLRTAGKEILGEGVTEAAQLGVSDAGHIYSGDKQGFSDAIDYADAAAKGAAGAGPLTAATSLTAPVVNATGTGYRALRNGAATAVDATGNAVDAAKTAIGDVQAGYEGRTSVGGQENGLASAAGAKASTVVDSVMNMMRTAKQYGQAAGAGVKQGVGATDLGARLNSLADGLPEADAEAVRDAVARGVQSSIETAGSVVDHVTEAVKGVYGGAIDNATAERIRGALGEFEGNPEALGEAIKSGIQTTVNMTDAAVSGVARGAADSQLGGQVKSAIGSIADIGNDPAAVHQFAYDFAKQAGDTAGTGVGAVQGLFEGVNESNAVVALKGYLSGLPKDSPDARERTREATRAALDKAYAWMGDAYAKTRGTFTPSEQDTPAAAEAKNSMADFLAQRLQEIDPASVRAQTPAEAAKARAQFESMMGEATQFAEQAKTEFANPFVRRTLTPEDTADDTDFGDIGYGDTSQERFSKRQYDAQDETTESQIAAFLRLPADATPAQAVRAMQAVKDNPVAMRKLEAIIAGGQAAKDAITAQDGPSSRGVNDYGATDKQAFDPSNPTQSDELMGAETQTRDSGFGEFAEKQYHPGPRGEFHAVRKGAANARTKDYRVASADQDQRAATEGQIQLGWSSAYDYLNTFPTATANANGKKIMDNYRHDYKQEKYDAAIDDEMEDPNSPYNNERHIAYHDGEALNERALKRANDSWNMHINREVINGAKAKIKEAGNRLAFLELDNPAKYKETTGQTPRGWRTVVDATLGADYLQAPERAAEIKAQHDTILKGVGFPTSGGEKIDAELRIPDKAFAALRAKSGTTGNVTIVFNDLGDARTVFGGNAKKEVMLNPTAIYNYGKERLKNSYDKLDAATQQRMFAEGLSTLLTDPRIAGVTDTEGNAVHVGTDGSIKLRNDKPIAFNPDETTATAGELSERARADSGSEFDRKGGTEGKQAAKKVRALAEVYTLGELHASYDVLEARANLLNAKKAVEAEESRMLNMINGGLQVKASAKDAQRQAVKNAAAARNKAQAKVSEVMAQHADMLEAFGIDDNTFSKVGRAVFDQLDEVERRLEAADRIGLKDADALVDEELANAGESNYSRERASEGGFGSTDTSEMNSDGRSTDVSGSQFSDKNVNDRPFKYTNPRARSETPTMRRYEENFADSGEPVAVGIEVGSRSRDEFKRSIDTYIKSKGDDALPALKEAITKLEGMPSTPANAAKVRLAKQAIEQMTPKRGAEKGTATTSVETNRPVNTAALKQTGLPKAKGHEAYMKAPVDGGNEQGRSPSTQADAIAADAKSFAKGLETATGQELRAQLATLKAAGKSPFINARIKAVEAALKKL